MCVFHVPPVQEEAKSHHLWCQEERSGLVLLPLLSLGHSHYPLLPQGGSLVPDCMLHFTIVLKEFERQDCLSFCPPPTLFWTRIVQG